VSPNTSVAELIEPERSQHNIDQAKAWRGWRALIGLLAWQLLAIGGTMELRAQNSAGGTRSGNTQADPTVVSLQPFEVIADPRDNYQALNTTSLSGTNRPLERLPVTAEIFNSQMLEDVGTTDMLALLANYMTGIGAPAAENSSQDGAQSGDRFAMTSFSIRGLGANNRRNGFLTLGNLTEGFAYDRVEIVRGPQSLLYGTSPAGGVVNVITKKAILGKNDASIQAKFDSEGTRRLLFDGNVSTAIKGRRAALRTLLLDAKDEFWRSGLGRETKAGFLDVALELLPRSRAVLRYEMEDRTTTSIQGLRGLQVTGAPAIVPNNSRLAVMLAERSPALGQIGGGFLTWDNVDSLTGRATMQLRRERFDTITLSLNPMKWLSGKVVAAQIKASNDQANANGVTALTAPRTAGNPLDAWAIGYRPAGLDVSGTTKGIRAMLAATFEMPRQTKHELVVGIERTVNPNNRNFNYNFYQVDSQGNFVVNQNQLNTANGGKTIMPIQWVDVQNNRDGFVVPRQRSYTVNNVTYVRGLMKSPNPAFVTPDNPLGFNGGSANATINRSANNATFLALFSTWMDGQLETMAGARYDEIFLEQVNQGRSATGSGTTGNLGAVWTLRPAVSVYASASSNFTPGSTTFAQRFDGANMPDGRGEGIEGGLKINGFGGRLSGSIALFRTDSRNQSAALSAEARSVTDPSGINGSYYATLRTPNYNFDRVTKGIEISGTAKPTRNWRLMFGYSFTNGEEGSSVTLPFYYNDEFKTNASGQVLLADGTPLRVPINSSTAIAADGKTYPASVATQILTVNILRSGDAAGNYRAQLAADSGRIQNAAQLGLLISGVGTGRVGLPIAQHQLGFTPPVPGIDVRFGGERTSGFPRQSVTLTSMYTFTEGWKKGLGLGLNGRLDFDTIRYYYNDQAAGNRRTVLYGSDRALVNLIVNYKRPLMQKLLWTVQINVNNLTDQRQIETYPNVATGIIDNAAFRSDPRTIVFTSTISF
jgi:outer membrane receptor protein involved in Fe transport